MSLQQFKVLTAIHQAMLDRVNPAKEIIDWLVVELLGSHHGITPDRLPIIGNIKYPAESEIVGSLGHSTM